MLVIILMVFFFLFFFSVFVRIPEGWPGFDTLPTTPESLWDNHTLFSPLPTSAENRATGSLWGSLVGGMSSVWPSSLWSTTPTLTVPDKKSDDETDLDVSHLFFSLFVILRIYFI